jgi:penicillin-binding protein 1A
MDKRKTTFFSPFFRFLKFLVLGTLAITVVVFAAGYGYYVFISNDLPKLDKIEDYQPPVMAEVFDDQGKKIGEFWTEARILTPIDKIPKKIIEGFVASEDDRFFQHGGVDPYGILRAFLTNLQAGHIVQGASTITQQVTKALLLSPEKTYGRKIKEAILATRIEQNFTKDQILYIYLNQIFFGNRAYGIAAAARNYFHKDIDQLNLAEIAMIVGLAKAPSLFNPLVNPQRALQRMNYVIDRMLDEHYITKKEAEQAKLEPIKVFRANLDKEFNLKYAPYFVEQVRRSLQQKYGTDALYKGGWKIYTTANLEMNQQAQKAVLGGVGNYIRRFGYRGPLQHLETQANIDDFFKNQHLSFLAEQDQLDYLGDPEFKKALSLPTPLSSDRRYEAVITKVEANNLQVTIGNTRGKVGREDFSWAKNPARGVKPWNPKIGDVVEVKIKNTNQKEGSALTTEKNFILDQASDVQAAIYSYEPFSGQVKAIVGGQDFERSEFNRATQARRQPGSSIKPIIYAAAVDKGYTPGTVIMDSPIVYEESQGKFWSPRNYGGKYYGPTTFRSALVNSRNVVTVRIVMDIGTHYVDAFMRKLGLSTPIQKYYSMALGANDVILAELATAYGTFVTGGIKPQTYMVEKIVDPHGKIIEEHQDPKLPFLISYKALAQEPKEGKSENTTPAEDEKNKTSPQVAEKTETQPSVPKAKSWEQAGFNESLLEKGIISTDQDNLHLTEYEKKILYGDYIPKGYAITPKTAMTMVSILQDVVRAGTGGRARALEKPAGGKTGTTNNETDVWFIGFTPDLLTGVWLGFDDKAKSLGRGATGGAVAAPVWLAYMKEATKHYPTKDFSIPKWIDLTVYEAPIQVGMGVGDAELGDAGVGTGVAGTSESGSGGAEFFTKDLE